jgi:hypothetical protein
MSKKHKREQETVSNDPIFPNAPLWLPRGKDWQALSPQVQTAAAELIVPLYRETVLGAPTAVERMAAETLVYVTWLEVLEQAELGKHLYTKRPRNPCTNTGLEVKVDDFIDRYLLVAQAKTRAGKFLMRVKGQWQQIDEDRYLRRLKHDLERPHDEAEDGWGRSASSAGESPPDSGDSLAASRSPSMLVPPSSTPSGSSAGDESHRREAAGEHAPAETSNHPLESQYAIVRDQPFDHLLRPSSLAKRVPGVETRGTSVKPPDSLGDLVGAASSEAAACGSNHATEDPHEEYFGKSRI